MKWVSAHVYEELYVDEVNKIIGKIFKPIGGTDIWYAEANKEKLGNFYGKDWAKKAVESKFKEMLL